MDLVVHGHKLNVDRQPCGQWFAARLTWRFRCRFNRKNMCSSGHYYLIFKRNVYEHLRIGGCALKLFNGCLDHRNGK